MSINLFLIIHPCIDLTLDPKSDLSELFIKLVRRLLPTLGLEPGVENLPKY